MDIKRKFGEKVRQLRLAKKLSQEALALESGIDRTYISDIEKGERNVSITIIEKLAIALNVSISSMFEE